MGIFGSYADENSREFDITIIGASGFTGRLAVENIMDRIVNGDKDYKVAIAGRRLSKLHQVLEQYKLGDKITCIQCDTLNLKSLIDLARRTKVVCNLAGPYATSGGENVVSACVQSYTHYCEISSEVNYIRDIITKYHDSAVEKGVKIVCWCGLDSLPWCILTQKMAEQLNEPDGNDSIERIDLFDEIKSAPSGGTIKTALQIRQSQYKNVDFDDVDPLLHGGDSTFKTVNRNVKKYETSTESQLCSHLLPFFMANVNFSCVKRTNAILGFSQHLIYKEGLAFFSILSIYVHWLKQFWFYVCLLFGIVYKPGDGPSRSQMDSGFLEVCAIATSKLDKKCIGHVSVNEDPGYSATAKMAVECSLLLAEENTILTDVQSGVITPAVLNKNDALLNRLQANDILYIDIPSLHDDNDQNIVENITPDVIEFHLTDDKKDH